MDFIVCNESFVKRLSPLCPILPIVKDLNRAFHSLFLLLVLKDSKELAIVRIDGVVAVVKKIYCGAIC